MHCPALKREITDTERFETAMCAEKVGPTDWEAELTKENPNFDAICVECERHPDMTFGNK